MFYLLIICDFWVNIMKPSTNPPQLFFSSIHIQLPQSTVYFVLWAFVLWAFVLWILRISEELNLVSQVSQDLKPSYFEFICLIRDFSNSADSLPLTRHFPIIFWNSLFSLFSGDRYFDVCPVFSLLSVWYTNINSLFVENLLQVPVWNSSYIEL